MLTETSSPGLKQGPYWQSLKFWLWLTAGLVAALVFFGIVLFPPKFQTKYLPEQFDKIVVDEQERGFFKPQTDDAGNSYVWTQGKSYILFDFLGRKPIEITFEIRSAAVAGGPDNPVTILANGVEVGKIQPDPKNPQFQNLNVRFTPPSGGVQELKIELVTPTFRPNKDDLRALGTMLKSVTVNKTEAWSSIERRTWLIGPLPFLVLIVLLGVRSRKWSNFPFQPSIFLINFLTIVPAIIGLGFATLATLILSRIGVIDKTVYWVWLVGCAYLALFFGAITINLPVGQTSLYQRAYLWLEPKVRAHPLLWALVGLTLANGLITGVFYARAYIETGNLDWFARYWDGPEYTFIANGLYDPQNPLLKIADFARHSRTYWAAHFPGYPLVLMGLAPLVSFTYAPMLSNFIITSLLAGVFYAFVREFKYTPYPFWLSLVILVLPLRWLIYHSVGASEPLFILFATLSIYMYKKERYVLMGLVGAAAAFTRPPGVMLAIGLALAVLWVAGEKLWAEQRFSVADVVKTINWRAIAGIAIIPVGLLAAFLIFWWRYGDFLAYFRIEEEVKHFELFPMPNFGHFQDSNNGIFYYFLLEVAGLALLWKQKRFDLFWVGLSMVLFTFFLRHPDILRYSLPAFPLILAIPFAEQLSGKLARWLAIPVLIAIYFYSWSVISNPDKLAGLDTWEAMLNILR